MRNAQYSLGRFRTAGKAVQGTACHVRSRINYLCYTCFRREQQCGRESRPDSLESGLYAIEHNLIRSINLPFFLVSSEVVLLQQSPLSSFVLSISTSCISPMLLIMGYRKSETGCL